MLHFSKVPTLALLLFVLISCSSASNGQQGSDTYRIAFYNVENLFDTVDDPDKMDEEFTPTGKLGWSTERYQTKLQRIEQVMGSMGYPAIIGLCEVENKTVLEDLASTTGMAKGKYQVVHFESPDVRGIDVALMYQKKAFKLLGAETIRLEFPLEITPDIPGYTSRDVLVVEGYLPNKQHTYIIVAHFPSRRGGLKESEPKRTFVAGQIRKKIDQLAAKDPDAGIIVMGDLNDETTNKSVAITLGAHAIPTSPTNKNLYNCFSELDAAGDGSYNYRGEWNMLDHIILSGQFFQNGEPYRFQSASILKEDYLFYKDDKYGLRPNRTYGGPNYYGGYSDHLPVYIDLKRN